MSNTWIASVLLKVKFCKANSIIILAMPASLMLKTVPGNWNPIFSKSWRAIHKWHHLWMFPYQALTGQTSVYVCQVCCWVGVMGDTNFYFLGVVFFKSSKQFGKVGHLGSRITFMSGAICMIRRNVDFYQNDIPWIVANEQNDKLSLSTMQKCINYLLLKICKLAAWPTIFAFFTKK